MRPEQVLKVLAYRKANSDVLDELELSIPIQPLYERVMGITAQKARFLAAADGVAQATPLDRGEALDLYALSEDERYLVADWLVTVSMELADILKPYSEDYAKPVAIDEDKVVFKAFNPFLLIPRNVLHLVAQNLKNAAAYALLKEWYSLSNLKQEAVEWELKYELEKERLVGILLEG